MKNRILALLLAGLITASMASCTDTKRRDEGLGTGGTEQIQTKDPNTNQNNGNPTGTITWQDVNEQVYVISDKLTLTEEYGFEMLDKELQKKSEFYNEEFLGMTSSRDPFSSKESE